MAFLLICEGLLQQLAHSGNQFIYNFILPCPYFVHQTAAYVVFQHQLAHAVRAEPGGNLVNHIIAVGILSIMP